MALLEFEKFKEQWADYPGAIRVWDSNWKHVEQLYNYTEAIRKVMYTTYTEKIIMPIFSEKLLNISIHRKISA